MVLIVLFVYFDVSVFVKFFIIEIGSLLVFVLWDGCDVVLFSCLVYFEVCVVFVVVVCNYDLIEFEFVDVECDWEDFWVVICLVEFIVMVE